MFSGERLTEAHNSAAFPPLTPRQTTCRRQERSPRGKAIALTDEQFFELCQLNRELRIERTATGELVIMPPTGSETGAQNFSLTGRFAVWVEQDGTGIGFDSSTGFTLPNGAGRAPDVSWIGRERWEVVPQDKRQKFAPICPDFVVELKSPTDSLAALQEKMQEYIDNGAALGWLIDPSQKRECLDNPKTVGSALLPGFTLKLNRIW